MTVDGWGRRRKTSGANWRAERRTSNTSSNGGTTGAPTDSGSGVIPTSAGTDARSPCPEVAAAPGRVVSLSANPAGATASYSCLSGYYPSGEATRTCRADGTWSGPPPDCLPVDCRKLADPDHGVVAASATTLGAQAQYRCSDGYDLVGAPARVCQADGTWSGLAPSCSAKDCGALATPTHGSVKAAATTFGATATYACATGYELSAPSSRSCQADGTWSGSVPTCVRPSCRNGGAGAGSTCGVDGNGDCCSSLPATGGTFFRDNDTSYTASVSSFLLDKYEVTVGRFRAFVNAGKGTAASPPGQGTGTNPRVAGSGWNASWNANLVAAGQLPTAVACAADFETWTGGDDSRPMNCISWYEAFAFCIWDGGRLPTELEWNYAAIGGAEQRTFPWGTESLDADSRLAVHNCNNGGSTTGCHGVLAIAAVGSAPAGIGRWGQLDLAGNIAEFTLDLYADYPALCTDCANLSSGTARTMRGGSFYRDNRTWIEPTRRGSADPAGRFMIGGVRCARDS